MLARAFHDDPVFGWLLPAERSRHRRLRRYFVTELHHETLREQFLAGIDLILAGITTVR